MNTDRLMRIAVEMAGLTKIPADSTVYHPGEGIERILAGIDLKAPEIQLAKTLGYDAVLTHHPAGGAATLGFHRVLYRHVDQMVAAGVPEAVARTIIDTMAAPRRLLDAMSNYDHAPSIARLLDMPFLNVHTPLDELGRRRLAEAAARVDRDATVAELIDHLLNGFGEFRHAATSIEPVVGTPSNRVGRIAVSHGAGTNGGYEVAKAYFDHGVDTVVYIHCRPDEARRLREAVGDAKTLLVTGHIASDSIGINPYLDRLRADGLEITAVSGILPA